MMAVSWDDDVAAFAQDYVMSCVFAHSQGSGYGENIYSASGSGWDYDG